MKYYIHYRNADGLIEQREVEGEPVSFKGFEQFNFFLHASEDAIQTPRGSYSHNFKISEVVTGRAITPNCASPEVAKKKAREILRNQGPQKLGERIAYYLLGPGREET